MNTSKHDRTTICVLTPLAPGAVATVRVQGPSAVSLVQHVFEPAYSQTISCLPADRLCFGRVMDEAEPLDDVVVAARPRSGEAAGHVVDICTHGGVRIVQRLVMLLERSGAALVAPDGDADEPAWPAASRIEREIDTLLPLARTRRAALWLAQQRAALGPQIEAIASRAAGGAGAAAAAELQPLVDRCPAARRLIDGATVLLAGPVNAGKSTLANRLLGREQSIAADLPGTTRDWVSGATSIAGVPVEVIDTAGLGESDDALEREAVRRGQARAASADVVLWVVDASRPVYDSAALGWPAPSPRCGRITVLNKIDAGRAVDPRDVPDDGAERVVAVSARRGDGIDSLEREIVHLLGLGSWSEKTAALLTVRQQAAATRALAMLECSPIRAAEALIECLLDPAPGGAGGKAAC